MFTCVYWSCIHFWMCVDLRDQSRNQIIIELCMKYLVPIMSKLDWLRTSAHPLNQRHPLFSWLVFAAYCCLFTGKLPRECQKDNRLKMPPPPRKKQAWLHFNSMQHLDAFGFIKLRSWVWSNTRRHADVRFFFGPTGLAKLGYVTSPSVPQLLTLNLAFSWEMSSNVSFQKNYGASPKMEKWKWQFSASTLLSWKREVWTHVFHLDRHHQGR